MLLPTTVLWLALNIYHEGRGEPVIAQKAIGQVTLNRSREYGMTVEEVVKDPHQFSWRKDRRKRNAKPWKDDPETWTACSISAARALATPDVTGGSTHFLSPMKRPPKWVRKMKRTAKHGKITFYREKS